MNKDTLQAQYDYFSDVVDVTLRAVAQLEDVDLEFRATPAMRTLRELIIHIFAQEECHARGAQSGEITEHDIQGSQIAAESCRTVSTLVDWAEGCHSRARDMLKRMTDSQLQRPVVTPYGEFPGWKMMTFSYDEHWHHRGQIYTYIRLLGKKPLFLYDYPE